MRRNAIREKLGRGERVVNGWCSIPSSYSAEVMAHCGWDSVTVDMQHGPIDFQAAVTMLQAISTSSAVPMVRVPWNEPGIMMKVLDAGAYGIICPMINTKAEAEALVRACRYPPMGERSMGANRAVQYAGADYWQHANEEVLLFAMIETQSALDNLDEILTVKGLDGTYIGPTDLAMSLNAPPTLAPEDARVLEAMATIRTKTQAAGLIACSHTDGPATAAKRFGEGFQLCTLLNDARIMAAGASAFVREIRGEAKEAAAKTY